MCFDNSKNDEERKDGKDKDSLFVASFCGPQVHLYALIAGTRYCCKASSV